MSEKAGANNNTADIKAAVEKFRAIIEREIKAARQNNEFRSVIIAENNGYRLVISITPDGTPLLVLQSPNLKNRFVFKDYTVLVTVSELLNSALNNQKLRVALEKTFPPKTGRGSMSILEL